MNTAIGNLPGPVLLLFVLVGGIAGLPSLSLAQQVTVSTSGQYTSGEYFFTESTDVFSWTTGLSVTQGRMRLGLSIPLLVQTNPWISYTGAGPTPSGGPLHQTVGRERRGETRRNRRLPVALSDTVGYRTTGWGDPQFRALVNLTHPDSLGLSVQVTTALKPPLADVEEGFGTGAWDAGVGLSVSHSILPWFVMADATYWWLGDLDGLPLNENLAYSAGIGWITDDGQWGLLASLSGSTTIIDNVDPPLSLSGGISYSPSGKWGVNTTVSSGLSEGAADWSFGAGVHATLGAN